jgi:hypothetical protein
MVTAIDTQQDQSTEIESKGESEMTHNIKLISMNEGLLAMTAMSCTCPQCGGNNFEVYGAVGKNDSSARCLDCSEHYFTVDVLDEAGEKWRADVVSALTWQDASIAEADAAAKRLPRRPEPRHLPRRMYATLASFGMAKIAGSVL